ncbi:DUF4238 domain-containing protein [Rhizobium sp. NIBRBAC000502774]|nr:DUF4238 domain-containing protein [Rhizobium sp. NIBRBAC000502774]
MIDYSKPPKFEKRNHHIVPQFWQRHFRDADQKLFKTSSGKIVVGSPKSTMSEDYMYLAFDDGWRPTDAVEDQLCQWESIASELIAEILPPKKVLSDEEWSSLCIWIGISTSRHPNVLDKYKPTTVKFALELATAHDFADYSAFRDHLTKKFGSSVSVEEYDLILTKSADELLAEVEFIRDMSKYDPKLPQTDALFANFTVAICVNGLDLTLIDTTPDQDFILGNNPLPNTDLSRGFSVPLSRHVALIAQVPADPSNPTKTRRAATASDIDNVNGEQARRSVRAIASSKAILENWIGKLIPESADV